VRVVVSTVGPGSTAHRALLAEGVPHTERVCRGVAYAEMLAEEWRKGCGFVLVERDIVPWVGAIQQLVDCGGDWCAFRYAFRGSTVRSLGLVKFSGQLVRLHPDLAEDWDGKPLEELEGAMLGSINQVTPVCKHGPPVGRVRGLD
jgi:hypothetical protein